MKLVRLTSRTNDGIFDNSFTQPIELKPYSKIAFQNIAVNLDFDILIIDNDNRTIQYETSTGALRTVLLNPRTYRITNYNSFVINLFNVMNSGLTFQGKELGTTWDVFEEGGFLTMRHFIPLELRYLNQISATNNPNVDSVNIRNNTRGNGLLDRRYFPQTADILGTTQLLGNTNTRYLYSTLPLATGSGYFRFKIGNLGTANTDPGYRLCVVKNNNGNQYNDFGGILPEVDILASLWIKNNSNAVDPAGTDPIQFTDIDIAGGTAQNIVAGLPTLTIAGVENDLNDFIEVHLSGNNVIFGKRNSADNPNFTEFHRKDLGYRLTSTNPEFLYVAVIFYEGNTKASIMDIQATLHNKNALPLLDRNDLVYNQGNVAIRRITPTRITSYQIQMENKLFKFLGFERQTVVGTGNLVGSRVLFNRVRDFVVTSEEENELGTTTQSFIIEGLNLNLDSYDGFIEKQASYLYVLPQKQISDNQLVFHSNYPIFINLRNRNQINLRNIRLRLIDNDLSPVETIGINTMSILIADKEETE